MYQSFRRPVYKATKAVEFSLAADVPVVPAEYRIEEKTVSLDSVLDEHADELGL